MLPGIDVVFEVSSKLFYVLIQLFVEAQGLHAVCVDLSNLVVAVDDDFELSFSLVLLPILAVQRVRNQRDYMQLFFDSFALS